MKLEELLAYAKIYPAIAIEAAKTFPELAPELARAHPHLADLLAPGAGWPPLTTTKAVRGEPQPSTPRCPSAPRQQTRVSNEGDEVLQMVDTLVVVASKIMTLVLWVFLFLLIVTNGALGNLCTSRFCECCGKRSSGRYCDNAD
jgi:hypothetical protein